MRKNIHIYYDNVLDKELIDWLDDKNNWKGYRSRNSFILGMLYDIYGHNNNESSSISEDKSGNKNNNKNTNNTNEDICNIVAVKDNSDTTANDTDNSPASNLSNKFINKFRNL